MRAATLVGLLVAVLLGCHQTAPRRPELVDASESLEAVRAAFNAAKGRPRFVTLLAPT
jgi:hypothetical protein